MLQNLTNTTSATETFRYTSSVLEGFWFLARAAQRFCLPISLVRLPSGGLGLQNARSVRVLLPGAPNPAFAVPPAVEIPPLPIQASILSHSTSSNCSFSAPRRRESEKPARDIVRMPGATTATHYSAVRCKSERPSGSGQAGQPSILQWKRQPSERNQSQTRRAEPNSAKRSNTVRMAPVTDSSG